MYRLSHISLLLHVYRNFYLPLHHLDSSNRSLLGSLFRTPSLLKLGYGINDDLSLLASSVPALRPYLAAKNLRRVVDLNVVIDRIETLDPQLLRDYDIQECGWDKINGGLSGKKCGGF